MTQRLGKELGGSVYSLPTTRPAAILWHGLGEFVRLQAHWTMELGLEGVGTLWSPQWWFPCWGAAKQRPGLHSTTRFLMATTLIDANVSGCMVALSRADTDQLQVRFHTHVDGRHRLWRVIRACRQAGRQAAAAAASSRQSSSRQPSKTNTLNILLSPKVGLCGLVDIFR